MLYAQLPKIHSCGFSDEIKPRNPYITLSQQKKTFKSCSLESKRVVIVLMTFQTGQKGKQ